MEIRDQAGRCSGHYCINKAAQVIGTDYLGSVRYDDKLIEKLLSDCGLQGKMWGRSDNFVYAIDVSALT